MDIKNARNEMAKIEKATLHNNENNNPYIASINKQNFNRLKSIVEEAEKTSTIDEWVFIKYFLPLFYNILKGNENILEDKNAYYLLTKWLFLSGSHYSKVKIVNDKGELLFTVPPLTVTVNMHERFKNVDMSSLGEETVKLNNWIKGKGDELLDSVINKGKVNIDQKILNKYSKEWYEIFKRYKMEPPDNKSITSDNNEELDLDYD